MPSWQVQDAKAQLSEVIKRARTEGPQTITRHGTAQVVVISVEEFQALSDAPVAFAAHLLSGPKSDAFEVPHDDDLGRPVSL